MSLDGLELARALMRCPSVTPAEAGAQVLLAAELEKLGFNCHLKVFSEPGWPDVSNLYARYGTEAPNFCFAGHTDVVPVGDEALWSADPFGAEIRDGVLYGRGAADMKTAIACFAAAADRFIRSRNGAFGGSISFLITGDEEGPAVNGTKKLLEWITDEGEKLDACLVGEPTSPTYLGEMVKIGRRGSLNGRLTVKGIQGHTAYPHLADNPIHRLVKMLDAVTAEELDRGTEHFQASTLQISSVDVGNPATNVIPAEAQAMFNVRFNDLHRAEDVEAWVRERLDRVGGDYDLDIHVSGEAFLTPPGELSTIVSDAIEKTTGKRPELSTSGGTSDARFIKDYCPVAEFGLIGQTMHKTDERIAVTELDDLTDIYLAILEAYFEGR